MRLKSYFAGTVEAAMALARQELGPEAMLVQSRRATAETRYLGEYEVVFATAPAEPAESATAGNQAARTEPAAGRDELAVRLSGDIADLKKQLDRLADAVAHSRFIPNAARTTPNLNRILTSLIDGDADPHVAYDLIDKLQSSGEHGFEAAEFIVRQFVRTDNTLGSPQCDRKIVAIVGAPGAGKTTTLVKMAALYGLSARRPTQIISADVIRIAAAEQLRLYAGILGVGFDCVETGFALAQALEDRRARGLVLIDTPGLSATETGDAADIAEFIANDPDIDTHLVIPASMRLADMQRVVDRYSMFSPQKLLFTKIDETACYGPLLSLPWKTGKPVSFLAGGQRIPEDLEPATVERILDLAFTPLSGRERSGIAVA